MICLANGRSESPYSTAGYFGAIRDRNQEWDNDFANVMWLTRNRIKTWTQIFWLPYLVFLKLVFLSVSCLLLYYVRSYWNFPRHSPHNPLTFPLPFCVYTLFFFFFKTQIVLICLRLVNFSIFPFPLELVIYISFLLCPYYSWTNFSPSRVFILAYFKFLSFLL